MAFIVVILTGLLPLCVSTTPSCPSLKLFNGEEQVFNFTCHDYDGTSNCQDSWSSFPANLSHGSSVGKPRDFRVAVFRRSVTSPTAVVQYSGLVVHWKVPIEGVSRKHTKGYFLKLHRAGIGQTVCWVFDLRHVDLNSSKMSFSYEYFPFDITSMETYRVELFSLPPPSEQEYKEGLYQNYVITVPGLQDFSAEDKYPMHWTTWITVQSHSAEGKIQVAFGFPEANSSATFSRFLVQLTRKGVSNPQDETYINKKRSETIGSWNFSNVPSGTYMVQVTPEDHFRNVPGQCECWEEPYYFKICGNCQTTQTELFNFTRTIPPTVDPHTMTHTTVEPQHKNPLTVEPQDKILFTKEPSSLAQSTEELQTTMSAAGGIQDVDPDASGDVVAVMLPLTFAALIMLLAVIFICFWKRRKLEKKSRVDYNSNMVQRGAGDLPYRTVQSDKRGDLMVPDLSRKTVMLLASEDHKYFRQVVNKFADFLEQHCQCQVLFAPRQLLELRKTSNTYCWLSRQIDRADCVFIISSEAAFRLYSAFQDGQVYKDADFGPEGDLFTPGIQHICGKIASNQSVHKVITVHFDHTAPRHHLPIAALPSRHYRLPAHLSSLLLHIHDLDHTSMDLSKVSLPLQSNIEELTGGQEWLTAVHQSANYERLNPDWFDIKFGCPQDILSAGQSKTVFSKQVSNDSGYGGQITLDTFQRRLSSVSSYGNEVEEWPILCRTKQLFSRDCEQGDNCTVKDEFIAPSEILSTFTVHYSEYISSDRPLEIDGNSTVSDQFRRMNDRYECKHRLASQNTELNFMAQEAGATSDLTAGDLTASDLTDRDLTADDLTASDLTASGQTELFLPSDVQVDTGFDCLSLSSVQSV